MLMDGGGLSQVVLGLIPNIRSRPVGSLEPDTCFTLNFHQHYKKGPFNIYNYMLPANIKCIMYIWWKLLSKATYSTVSAYIVFLMAF